jgi:EpsI family protein
VSTRFWIVAGLLLLARVVIWAEDHRPTESLKMPLSDISSQMGGWRASRELTLTPGVLKALAAQEYLDRIYLDDRYSAELFVAYYPVQRAGETMHSPNACLPGTGWEFSERAVAQLHTDRGVVTVNRDQIQKDGARMWLIYWYQSHDSVIADEYASKFVLFREAMFGGRTSGSFVRVSAPQTPGSVDALMSLAQHAVVAVHHCFRD